MSKEFMSPATLPPPVGYSHIAKVSKGTLIYLAGQFLVFQRVGPVDITEAAEAVGAGGFVAIGLSAVAMGLPYLSNVLPLGQTPGAVDSSGTIALISLFVGVEVAAAFILIVSELLEQTLLIGQESR